LSEERADPDEGSSEGTEDSVPEDVASLSMIGSEESDLEAPGLDTAGPVMTGAEPEPQFVQGAATAAGARNMGRSV
jgi:hypothetical protein